ncbi:MAG: polysaccharide biosynthesis/export family protein [Maritimibacter sp.]
MGKKRQTQTGELCVRRIVLLLIACAALAGCALPRGAPLQAEILAEANAENPTIDVVELTRSNVATASKWPTTGWSGRYKWLTGTNGPSSAVVRAGDVLNVNIWDNDANSLFTRPGERSASINKLAVSSAGEVFLPYVGEVVVNGLTPDGARRELQKAVERVAPSAQVLVEFKPGVMNTIDLVRGMARPGTIELAGRNMTILSALAQGGGISPEMRNPLVRVIRGQSTYEIPADALLADASKNALLRGGDKVVVDSDKRFFIALGASGVERPIYYDREKITALEAMSMAGGIKDTRADPTGILILRDYGAKSVDPNGVRGPKQPNVVFTLDITTAEGLFAARKFRIQPGDAVLVTESPAVALQSLINLFSTGALAANRLGL